jgi:hypothetical protein
MRRTDRAIPLAIGALVAGGMSCGDFRFVLGAGPGAVPQGCAAWAGAWTLTAPEPVAGVNTAAYSEVEPYLSPDARTLYFARLPTLAAEPNTPYQSVRATLDAPFGAAQRNDLAYSGQGESRFALSTDGLTAYLSSSRSGGLGGADIWMATRTSVSDSFGPWADLAVLGSAADEYDPAPTIDNLRLYFAVEAGSGPSKMMFSDRPNATASFAAPTPVPGLDGTDASNPTLSDDQLLIVFADRGSQDLLYALRASKDAPFGPPAPLPVVNTAAQEWEPHVRGCELFFSSDRPESLGGSDIFRSLFVAQ